MQSVIKGMVQVAGSTYRIVRVERGRYSVIRILDDQRVGSFTAGPVAAVAAVGIEPALLCEIRRVAMQGAKTSWAGHLALG
ncbi:MAG TPA: hypothetical protein VHM25_09390 [Polyangiaceae bacterium]|jgi:hypothetical protein|nr:hypothetical protein [Polyangiaceae bacterium]